MREKINKQRSRRRSGFSLIELLVALFIFATCLMFIFGIFPTAAQAVNQARYTFLATQVAQQELEYIKDLYSRDFSYARDQDPGDGKGTYLTHKPAEPFIYGHDTTLTTYIDGNENVIKFTADHQQPTRLPTTPNYLGGPNDPSNPDYYIWNVKVRVKYAHGSAVRPNVNVNDSNATGPYAMDSGKIVKFVDMETLVRERH